jgi:flavin reductase (DIM6/NTAB) family NADH-FMN oxidoreductase RutF
LDHSNNSKKIVIFAYIFESIKIIFVKNFEKFDVEKLKDNPFRLLNDDWMLITAGTENSFNTMTASWGGVGILWNKQVAFCFVRPTRHTYQFMEKNDYFTLTFYNEEYRDILNFCGKKSGRDTDKIKETGLIPLTSPNNSIYFEQARLVFECRKIYSDDIKPEFFRDEKIHNAYPLKDYHRMYIGEITNCLISE